MGFKNQSPPPEVDGDMLKLAREVKGLSLKELAGKLCLSHQHISQLEGNQLSIFFTLAHKIQVAKRVGAELGLVESDFLIYRANVTSPAISQPADAGIKATSSLPENENLFAKTGSKSTSVKSRLFLLPTLIIGCIAGGLASQIYSAEISIPDLAKIFAFNASSPQLPPPVNPVEESIAEPVTMATVGGEPVAPSISVNQEACAYQESDLTHYQTINPRKKGEMVYVLSREHGKVCIIDGQNKSVSLDLEQGGSQSVYGQAPFTVVSRDLSKFDLYFQGWKVMPNSVNAKAIRLDEANLVSN